MRPLENNVPIIIPTPNFIGSNEFSYLYYLLTPIRSAAKMNNMIVV